MYVFVFLLLPIFCFLVAYSSSSSSPSSSSPSSFLQVHEGMSRFDRYAFQEQRHDTQRSQTYLGHRRPEGARSKESLRSGGKCSHKTMCVFILLAVMTNLYHQIPNLLYVDSNSALSEHSFARKKREKERHLNVGWKKAQSLCNFPHPHLSLSLSSLITWLQLDYQLDY